MTLLNVRITVSQDVKLTMMHTHFIKWVQPDYQKLILHVVIDKIEKTTYKYNDLTCLEQDWEYLYIHAVKVNIFDFYENKLESMGK